MNVTDVKIRRVVAEGRMKALASITLDHEFVVHDLRVIEGNSGLFVAMPSKRTQEGIFRDVAHPRRHRLRSRFCSNDRSSIRKKTAFLFLGKAVFFLVFSSIPLRPIIE